MFRYVVPMYTVNSRHFNIPSESEINNLHGKLEHFNPMMPMYLNCFSGFKINKTKKRKKKKIIMV